jgi:signal recognition particle receptor subunit beta
VREDDEPREDYGNPKLENKGKMISMSTETDRTLFFDFMPMELGTIGGQKVRVQLYTVPGQVFYDATRKLVLRGADGVVFVADSQNTMRESNLDSLENLRTNLQLNRIDSDKVALVFQYNKRDLPNVDTVEEMTRTEAGNSPVVEASAINGTGVTATLRAAVAKILDNLKNNVDTTLLREPPLAAPDMTQKSGVTPHVGGTPKLSMRARSADAPRASTGRSPFRRGADPIARVRRRPDGDAVADDDPFAPGALAEPEPEAIDEPVRERRRARRWLTRSASMTIARRSRNCTRTRPRSWRRSNPRSSAHGRTSVSSPRDSRDRLRA